MNRQTLIEAIIRQTMVMIAQLATSGGRRTPLTQLANQVFLSLARELRAESVGSKIIADMFGLTLRAYHVKIKRLQQSESDQARSLWQAVVSFLSSKETVSRADLLARFHFDDHAMVIGIMSDLVDSGLVFRSGRGPRAVYRVVDLNRANDSDDDQNGGLASFLSMAIYRLGPISLEELRRQFPAVDPHQIQTEVERLAETKRIEKISGGPKATYRCTHLVLGSDAPEGWETAIFDHFQALANVVARSARGEARRDPLVGGSTFHYDLDEAHPLHNQVLQFFSRVRKEGSELRRKVDEYNKERVDTIDKPFRVVFYAGQNIVPETNPDND